jgi:hypothetical protein
MSAPTNRAIKPMWSAEQISDLKRLWADPTVTAIATARMIDRSLRSASDKARELGFGPKAETCGKPTGWTDERIEMVRSMKARGASFSEIAKELGGVSRSAVIAKMHRLGIFSVPKPAIDSPETPRVFPKQLKTPSNFTPSAAAMMLVEIPLQGTPWAPLEGSTPREYPVRRGECNWPLDDDVLGMGQLRCCLPADGAYCPAHKKLAYSPTKPRNIDGLVHYLVAKAA